MYPYFTSSQTAGLLFMNKVIKIILILDVLVYNWATYYPTRREHTVAHACILW